MRLNKRKTIGNVRENAEIKKEKSNKQINKPGSEQKRENKILKNHKT